MKRLRIISLILCGLFTSPGMGESNWQSFTLDNDIFVGNDSGYTNGLYYSWYQTNETGINPKPGWLTKPLMWTLDEKPGHLNLNAYTIGQSMITPGDITLSEPAEDDIPYSGFLFVSNNYLSINESYADSISTTIGIIGPASGAEKVQEVFHQLFGSDEPQGWHTQLHNEIVFEFSRGRAWRTWRSESGHFDLINGGEISLGTLESSVSTGMMLRYGRNMDDSYAVPLLTSSRTTNPVAVEGSWYLYAGLNVSYLANIVFADGNTFRNSRSINYDHLQVGAAFGLAYSWQNFSVTFAINDLDINGLSSEEGSRGLTRYGTLTFVWRG